MMTYSCCGQSCQKRL